MTRVALAFAGGFVVGHLVRRWIGIEIVRASEQRPSSPRLALNTTPVTAFPAWYREWITAQACVRARYDC